MGEQIYASASPYSHLNIEPGVTDQPPQYIFVQTRGLCALRSHDSGANKIRRLDLFSLCILGTKNSEPRVLMAATMNEFSCMCHYRGLAGFAASCAEIPPRLRYDAYGWLFFTSDVRGTNYRSRGWHCAAVPSMHAAVGCKKL